MSKRKQKISRDLSEVKFSCPAISVIIPLYNVEKYVGECLDSLLAQTFQNFEVIVVDDCSTDSSPAIVESYAEKFGGRLLLTSTRKNSGGCAVPRNVGLPFSRGEYIYFMDSDDAITPTAFEELYTLAKKYDAEVVYCEKNFEFTEVDTNIRLISNQYGKLVDKPTFQSADLSERVKYLLQSDIWGTTWTKLVQRKFLIENNLIFPIVRGCEDHLWTLSLLFFAKKFLRVPNAVYIYRRTETSITISSKKSPQQTLNLWLSTAILGLKWLDEKLDIVDFFKSNLPYRHAVLNFVLMKMFNLCLESSFKIQPFEVYETIFKEFGNRLGEHDVLISTLCTALNTQQKINTINQQKFNQFAAQAQSQVQKFNQFAAQAQQRIAELEAENRQLKEKV